MYYHLHFQLGYGAHISQKQSYILMMKSENARSKVAFDIETEGLNSEQSITVAGLLPPDRHASVILNNQGRNLDEQSLISVVEDESRNPLDLRLVNDEGELLDELAQLIFERFDREYNTLTAYNAETWRGGFDLPFLRTKCAQYDRDWPLDGLYFLDQFEIVSKRFNTYVSEDSDNSGSPDEKNSLVGAHRLLCNPDHEFDPFEDSSRAVSCAYNGEWTELVLHNVSDIHRTSDIAEITESFASPRDNKTYKL